MTELIYLILFIIVLVLLSNTGIIIVMSMLVNRINAMVGSINDVISIMNEINKQISTQLIEEAETLVKRGE